jgi:hypothetical protein
MEDHQRMLDRREAAEFLTERGFKTAPGTLANLATGRGTGPRFQKYGKKAVYTPDVLIAWAASRCVEAATPEPNDGCTSV